MANPTTPNLGLNKVDRTSPTTTNVNLKSLLDDNWDKLDVLNPWGDNNGNSRSYVRAFKNANLQNLSPNVQSKVIFEGLAYDTMGEWNSGLSRFTPKTAGHYLVSAMVGLSIPDANHVDLYIIRNGGESTAISRLFKSTGSSGISLSVNDIISLNPGDFIEIYVASSGSTNVEAFADRNIISIRRV